jgi:hypothetical protein
MFSTTKVMTLLPTSLLIFLAIKLMVMRKDPTEFRERFKAYKNGKSISEIYDGGLPKYGDGTIPVTTGGTGMPAPQFYGGISEEARPTADALERISNFAPYVGTI